MLGPSVIGDFEAILAHIREDPAARAVVLISGKPDNFVAGADIQQFVKLTTADEGEAMSRAGQEMLHRLERFPKPIVVAIHGACVGGGMELAASCHIRVADESAFFAFPEGARGIFVGGGGSVRAPKLIGTHRMLDMMLTGRVYKAAEAVPIGFAQYLVPQGEAFSKALELATRIATNAPMTNYALLQALPRIAEQTAEHGLLTESLMAAIVETAPEAQARVRDFLEGRAAKVKAD